jgi:hypothetical protein
MSQIPPPIQNSGKKIRPDKDPLNKFSWDSAPNWLVEMSERANFGFNTPIETKAFMEQFIRELMMTPAEQKKFLRPDVIPHSYRENYQELKNAFPRLNANPTGLTIEQILGIDRHFHRTYVNNNVAAQMLQDAGVTRFMSGKKWEMKHHLLTNYGWPEFSHDFRNLGAIQVGPEGVKSTGYGWGAKYTIPFTTIDMAAGGVYDIQQWYVFFLAQQMGIFGDERIWLGGVGRNTTGKGAPSLTGMCNDASRVNVTAPVTDLGYSDGKADFEDAWGDGLTSYFTNQVYAQPVKNYYVSTPGIAAQTFIEDSSAGDLKTLYQQLQHKWFMSGQLDKWYVSLNIIATAVASYSKATQAAFMFRLGPQYMRRTVVYPLQRKILSEAHKDYPDDIAFAFITGDILQFYDKNILIHLAAGTSAAKSEIGGWSMNGLFMSSDSRNMSAFRPPVRG